MSGYKRFSETSPVILRRKLRNAGFWGEVGKGLHDSFLGKMDYGTWTAKLGDKLEELGVMLNEFDPHDLISWYESGYSLDEAVQVALNDGVY